MRTPMRRLVKRVAIGAALAGLLLGSTVTASPAAAHPIKRPRPTCSGSYLDHYHTHGGKISVFVYYSSANGGTNCAWAQKETNRGTPEAMGLMVGVYEGGDTDRRVWDQGNFKYYAGPVVIQNTADDCIGIAVKYQDGVDGLGPFHCGS